MRNASLGSFRIVAVMASVLFITASSGLSEDAIEYKQFKVANISCDTGVSYAMTGTRLDIAFSAIAYSPDTAGVWGIEDIALIIGNIRTPPSQTRKFYVQHGPLLKYPAAVIYEAMGMQVDALGPGPKKGVMRTSAGAGLLVLPSQADVTGLNCVFSVDLSKDIAIDEKTDVIEVIIVETLTGRKEQVRVPLVKNSVAEIRYDYSSMRPDEQMQMVETLDLQIATLKKNQQNFKAEKDPEFGELQKKIEELEVERGMVFRMRLDREKVVR